MNSDWDEGQISSTLRVQNETISSPIIRKNKKNRLNISLNFQHQTSVQPENDKISENSFFQIYTLGEVIGQGVHSVVKKAWRKKNQVKNNQTFAVKVLRTKDPERISNFRRSFQHTRCIEHPSIVQQIELFLDEQNENQYLVMEYCEWPTLESVMKSKTKLLESNVKLILCDLMNLINHLHTKGVCHRDIKPDNILVDIEKITKENFQNKNDIILKLLDFEVCQRFINHEPGKVCAQKQMMWTVTGNIFYRAPEIFLGYGYDESVDVWAIGICLYQMVTGKLPFYASKSVDTINKIIHHQSGTQFLDDSFLQLSYPCKDLLKRMLTHTPRISAKQVIDHPFLIEFHTLVVKRSQDDENAYERNQFEDLNIINYTLARNGNRNQTNSFSLFPTSQNEQESFTSRVEMFKEHIQDNVHLQKKDPQTKASSIQFLGQIVSQEIGRYYIKDTEEHDSIFSSRDFEHLEMLKLD